MGPPPRSFRCDAHHCIMVWVLTHRIQGCGTNVRATTRGAPLGLRHPDHNKCAVVLEPVKDQGPCGWRATRPSLTASVRAGSTRLSVGAKKRLARSNKETLREEKMDRTLPANPPLTKIAPYKVSLTPV